jgi:uncharacterized protein HemX
MDTLDSLLSIINASGTDLYLKAILIVFAMGVGVWQFFRKLAARKEAAEAAANQAQQQSVQNNQATEQQHQQDGQDIRDQLGRP